VRGRFAIAQLECGGDLATRPLIASTSAGVGE
jgi:hypothetical protein